VIGSGEDTSAGVRMVGGMAEATSEIRELAERLRGMSEEELLFDRELQELDDEEFTELRKCVCVRTPPRARAAAWRSCSMRTSSSTLCGR
jgi:hypothetical protein